MTDARLDPESLGAALAGGDVASVILSPLAGDERLEESEFQRLAAPLVAVAQQAGAAAIVAFEPRVAARTGADGLHLEGDLAAVEPPARDMAVGFGNLNDRDAALRAGEAAIDYVFFGRLHRDIRPEPHRRNLRLAAWWSEVVSLPCIVSGGNVVGSVIDVAATGADFVALQSAIFAATDPADAVARANALLDVHAPRFADT